MNPKKEKRDPFAMTPQVTKLMVKCKVCNGLRDPWELPGQARWEGKKLSLLQPCPKCKRKTWCVSFIPPACVQGNPGEALAREILIFPSGQ